MEQKTTDTSVHENSNYSTAYISRQDEVEKIDLFKLLLDMWKGIKAGWWIPFVLALAVGVFQFVTSDRSYTPYYETSATVFVRLADNDNSNYQNRLTAEQMVTLFPYLMKNGVLNDAIQTQLGTEEIPGTVNISVSPSTNLLTFTVTGADPKKIYELLQAVIEVYPDTLSYIAGPTEFTMFKDMGIPSDPANSKPSELVFIKSAAISAGKIFIIGLVLLALYGMSIRTISSVEELKHYLNATNLGVLPAVRLKKRSNKKKNQLTIDNEQIPFGFGESLRMVRNRFERKMEEKNSRVVLVTSTIPGEGKTTAAVNLAMSLAMKGKKVLLIDGDMRNPSVAGILQLDENRKGLCEILTGKAAPEQVITVLQDSGLYVIPAGGVTRKSTDLLSSEKMKKLLHQVKEYADYVIVDTPPVMVLGDSLAVGKYVDGCIYVVRREQARRHVILEGFTQMAESGCQMLGTILNDDLNGGSGISGAYGRYGKYGKYGGYGKYGKYGYYGYGKKSGKQ